MTASSRVGGYLVALPEWLQTILGGDVRVRGRRADGQRQRLSGVGRVSVGVRAAVTRACRPDTHGEHVTIPTMSLIYSDIDHRQPRDADADECGWTHYGESDSHGDQPQWNPTQNGTGCTPHEELCGASYRPLDRFGALDAISAAAWWADRRSTAR